MILCDYSNCVKQIVLSFLNYYLIAFFSEGFSLGIDTVKEMSKTTSTLA